MIKQSTDKQAVPRSSDRENVEGLNQSCMCCTCVLLITHLSSFDTRLLALSWCLRSLSEQFHESDIYGVWCVSVHVEDIWR